MGVNDGKWLLDETDKIPIDRAKLADCISQIKGAAWLLEEIDEWIEWASAAVSSDLGGSDAEERGLLRQSADRQAKLKRLAVELQALLGENGAAMVTDAHDREHEGGSPRGE